jgi:hypothetical protein
MPAYTINELAKFGPLSRPQLYEAIHDGSLIVRKRGKKTLVLPMDWEAFLNALPRAIHDVPLSETGLRFNKSKSEVAA